MRKLSGLCRAGVCAALLVGLGGGLAHGDTGDTYRVTGERVNLRAGPSDTANVRSTVEAGDMLLELRQDGGWLGVRVVQTGEEGWIYSDLVERVSQSLLEGSTTSGPFADLSADFAELVGRIDRYLGYRTVAEVQTVGGDTLRVSPTREWLRYGGREGHLMAAAAFYQMWKNHRNNARVTLVLLGRGDEPYITVEDSDGGAVLSVRGPREQTGRD